MFEAKSKKNIKIILTTESSSLEENEIKEEQSQISIQVIGEERFAIGRNKLEEMMKNNNIKKDDE